MITRIGPRIPGTLSDQLNTIEAVGNLLLYYRSDLDYIKSFQICKRCQGDYLVSFRDKVFGKFLAEYRVARSVKKGQTENLLKTVMAHVKKKKPVDDVDFLAEILREEEITQPGKTAISLASKILFLNNPWEVLPYDRFVRIAIGYPGKTYFGYLEAVQKSREGILNLYKALPKPILAYLQLIEDEVASDIPHLDRIRKARFIDKVLWTRGRHAPDRR